MASAPGTVQAIVEHPAVGRGKKDRMNQLVYITASLYFEISDSYMFGGEGTVGYMGINLGGISDVEKITEEYIQNKRKEHAELFRVPVESVKLISKQEYDRETGKDEERDFDEYDY